MGRRYSALEFLPFVLNAIKYLCVGQSVASSGRSLSTFLVREVWIDDTPEEELLRSATQHPWEKEKRLSHAKPFFKENVFSLLLTQLSLIHVEADKVKKCKPLNSRASAGQNRILSEPEESKQNSYNSRRII